MVVSKLFWDGLIECRSTNFEMNRYVQSRPKKSCFQIGSDYWKELANLSASSGVNRVIHDYALVNGLNMHFELQMLVETDAECQMQASLH